VSRAALGSEVRLVAGDGGVDILDDAFHAAFWVMFAPAALGEITAATHSRGERHVRSS
jgi:hypothetical protein